jgi:hypothetical protein
MGTAILGPVLSDVQTLAEGKKFTLASAFYSAERLDAITIATPAADIMVRLNLRSVDAWVARAIAPDALLRFWKRHPNVAIRVFYSPGAHVKVYAGDDHFLVGSANFTVRGLGGTTDEILWLESAPAARRSMLRALNAYKRTLQPLTQGELRDYVSSNSARVRALQEKAKASSEASLPINLSRPTRIGDYGQFLSWLARNRTNVAATETLARANGKGQLSGHIRMNFYGIRQFLLARPIEAKYLRSVNPESYQLAQDAVMESAIKQFVLGEAVDEGGLIVDTWRTYLPERSGGKPKSGGGTSGNLNRMLPLVARHLRRVT